MEQDPRATGRPFRLQPSCNTESRTMRDLLTYAVVIALAAGITLSAVVIAGVV